MIADLVSAEEGGLTETASADYSGGGGLLGRRRTTQAECALLGRSAD
jgi:hypothetical protein